MMQWLKDIWLRRHVGQPDPELLFEQIARFHPGRARYSDMDRYRDFRQLFLQSEQGQRVLHEIMSWGHVYRSIGPKRNEPEPVPWIKMGERNMALKILTTINAEPIARPEQKER